MSFLQRITKAFTLLSVLLFVGIAYAGNAQLNGNFPVDGNTINANNLQTYWDYCFDNEFEDDNLSFAMYVGQTIDPKFYYEYSSSNANWFKVIDDTSTIYVYNPGTFSSNGSFSFLSNVNPNLTPGTLYNVKLADMITPVPAVNNTVGRANVAGMYAEKTVAITKIRGSQNNNSGLGYRTSYNQNPATNFNYNYSNQGNTYVGYSCNAFYVAKCGDGVIDNINKVGGSNTDGKQGINTVNGFIPWGNQTFAQETCDQGSQNSNTIPGRCKLDCSGYVPQPTPVCNSISLSPNPNPTYTPGTNATITCNANNAAHYSISVSPNGSTRTNLNINYVTYLFNSAGTFTINCTAYNSDYSQSSVCPARTVTVQNTSPVCEGFTVNPNPVQVGQATTLTCDGNQFSNQYSSYIQGPNGYAGGNNGSLPGPNNVGTWQRTPQVPGTYTAYCSVSNNGTQSVSCPAQIITVTDSDLWITKTVNPSQVASGGVLTFTITFGNSGSAVANNVTVRDILPPTVNYVPGSISISIGGGTPFNINNTTIGFSGLTLQPGQQGTMTLQATLNCGPCNGSLINTAQIFNPNDFAQATAPFSPIVPPASIVLDKTQSVGGIPFTNNTLTVASGDTITYQIAVSNIGGMAQNNLYIQDILPAGIDYVSHTINVPGNPGVVASVQTIGNQDVLTTSAFTLNAGQTALVTITATITTTGNVFTNIAKALILPATVVAQDSVDVVSVGPALILDKVIINPQAGYQAGDTIAYQITFTNIGSGAVFGANITDVLPPTVTYVSSSLSPMPNGASFSQVTSNNITSISYSPFTINPGQTFVMYVTGTVNASIANSTNTLNTAILSSNNHPTLVDTVAFPTAPKPAIVKLQSVNGAPFTHNQVTVNLNDTITYQVTVSNIGASPAINAQVTDYLPAGLQYISSTFSISNTNLTTGPIGGGTFVRYQGFTLNPGQSAIMTITAKVVDVTTVQSYNNIATLEFYNPYQAVSDSVTAIRISGANVGFTKTIANTGTYEAGDAISFTLQLNNAGPDTITNVVIQDIWPSTCVTFGNASVSNNAFTQTSTTNPYAWSAASLAAGQGVTITLNGSIKNDPSCAGTHYNTGIATYNVNNIQHTITRVVPFTIIVPDPGLCGDLDAERTVILVDDNDEEEAEFTCTTANGQAASMYIDCGNGQISPTVTRSSYTYTCEYDEDDVGDEPLVQCFVDGQTNNQCTQRVIVDEGRLADCGNGIIEGYEQCDLGEGTHTIDRWLDEERDVRAPSRYEGDTCRSCSIRNNDNDEPYEPVACFGSNTSLSVQRGEILPFRWYLQNNDNIVEGEDSCNNLDDGEIPGDSIQCRFAIYKNQLDNPVWESDDFIDCNVDEWGNDVYFDFFEQRYADAANALGKYTVDTRDFDDEGYGEYKLVLEEVRYDYCRDEDEEEGEIVERICDVDFAFTRPYMIARTALGSVPQASSIDLSDFYDINNDPIINSTDLNNILVVNESQFDGGSDVQTLINQFVTKYNNLGIAVNNASVSHLFEGAGQMTVKKVPGQQIYIFESNGASRLVLKELNSFTKPFTMIVKGMDLVVKGSLTTSNGMFIVQGGQISFVEPDTNACTQRQVVNGVFITDSGFGIDDANMTVNNELGSPWCNEGGLTVRGVLIGDDLEGLVMQRRSHLNEWFRVVSNTESAIKAERRNEIFNGASLLIDYNPSIWQQLPPGMSEFTDVLDVYRQ